MGKAFRCDRCKALIEGEVAARYPGIAAGYGEGRTHVRIEVGRTDSKVDFCEPCVREIASAFLFLQEKSTR